MASFTEAKGYSVINGVPSVNPAMLKTIDGYNVRDTFDPANDESDRELVQSMVANGFQSDKPITVRLVGRDLYVIAGHRRLAAVLAANAAGAKIKGIAIIPEGKGAAGTRDNAEATLDLLLSNSGKPLSPPERGAAFLRLRSYGWSDADIATKAGVSDKWVRELCKLARLDKRLRDLVKHGVVAPTLAIETAAAHGEKAADVVTAAAKLGKGANAGKATGKTVAAVTGKAGKNLKAAPAAPVVTVAPVKGATVRQGTIVPGNVVKGPFLLGKDMDDCSLFDQAGAVICEFPDVETAKAMLLLINQGWHTFHGKGGTSTTEPVAPAAPGKASTETVIAGKANAGKAPAMRTSRGK